MSMTHQSQLPSRVEQAYDEIVAQQAAVAQTLGVTRIGRVISTPDGHRMLGPHAKNIKCWGQLDAKSPTWERVRSLAAHHGAYYEVVFDAVHGRRHVLFFITAKTRDAAGSLQKARGAFFRVA